MMDASVWLPGQLNHQSWVSNRTQYCDLHASNRCLNLPSLPDGIRDARPSDYQSYDGWMAAFCHEPRNDARNGALAVFLPCVLYGKTKWRISEISKGGDWADSNFKAEDGCNENCLGCFLTSICTCCCCYFDEPCVLRYQVRHMYNITGRTCGDISMSLFCPCCSLIQIDREIRAREGQENLRSTRSFLRHQAFLKKRLESKQPSPRPPMVYAPSRGGVSNRAMEDLERDRSPFGNSPRLLPGNGSPAGEESELKKKSEHVPFCRKPRANSIVEITADGRTPSKDIGRELGPVGTALASLLGIASHPISDCPGRRDLVERDTARQLSQHELAECSSFRNEPSLVDSSTKTHVLEDCTIVQGDCQPVTVEHKLTECDTVSTPSSTGEVEVHSLPRCDTVITSYVRAPEQHGLTECDVVEVESTSTEIAEQHRLEECDTMAVISARAVEQHAPTECNTIAVYSPKTREQHSSKNHQKEENATSKANQQPTIGKRKKAMINPLWAVGQHSLTDCDTAATSIEVVKQHPLTDCQTTAVASLRSIKHHPLQDCSKVAVEHSTAPQQHGLTECKTTAIILPTVPRQHALPECTIVTVASSTIARQHTFIECKWQEYTSPVAVEQHIPKDCTGVPVNVPLVVEHYSLMDCEVSNEMEVQDQELSYIHDFTDCPVDKSVLEYYEKEEQKARQHTFANCPQTSSVGSQPKVSALQHALIDCTVNSKPQSRAVSISSSIKGNRGVTKAGDHRLVSCPVPYSPVDNKGKQGSRAASFSNSIRSHRRPSDTMSSKGKGPAEHRLASRAIPDTPEVNEPQDEKHSHDVSCLTQSLHHKHSSEEVVEAKGEDKDPKPEPALAAGDNHAHDVSCLTECRHHKRHSREETSGHGSSGGTRSSENKHRRRRHKKKDRHVKVAEEPKKEKEYTTAGDGSNSARNSAAQIALAKVLAAQQKGKGRSPRSDQIDGCDETVTPDSGEWFGERLETPRERERWASLAEKAIGAEK